jgi:carbamoylphosphate synthase large subunit
MVQFKYNDIMKRYDVKLPYTLAGEKSMVNVASISEDNKLTLHRELSLILVKQIVLKWDEYEHQLSRNSNNLIEGDK